MRVCFVGDAQTAKIMALFRRCHPDIDTIFLDHAAESTDFSRPRAARGLAGAGLVVVEVSSQIEPAMRLGRLRVATGAEIVAMPQIRLDGIASLEQETGPDGTEIRGVLELARGAAGCGGDMMLRRFLAGEIDMQQAARLDRSLRRLRALEIAHCDVAISDLLEERLHEEPVVFGLGAPTPPVILALFERLSARLGLAVDHAALSDGRLLSSLALPYGQRAFTPHDVAALGLAYRPDTHWRLQAVRLATRAMRLAERAEARAHEAPLALMA